MKKLIFTLFIGFVLTGSLYADIHYITEADFLQDTVEDKRWGLYNLYGNTKTCSGEPCIDRICYYLPEGAGWKGDTIRLAVIDGADTTSSMFPGESTPIKITTPYSGFWVVDDSITFQLGQDTLCFGSDTTSDFPNGFYINGMSTIGTKIIGGVVKCVGEAVVTSSDDEGNVVITGTEGARCLSFRGGDDTYLYGVEMIAAGVDGACITQTGYQGNRNFEVDSCTFSTDAIGYYQRDLYRGAIMHLGTNGELPDGEFHYKIHDCTIENSIHAAIRTGGRSFVYDNHIVMDARNDLYEYPQEHYVHGSANSVGLSFGTLQAGSQVYGNTVLADSSYSGFDCGILMERATGTSAEHIKIYDNHIEGFRGRDSHYGDLNCKGFKFRDWNWYVDIYDNTFIIKVDGDAETTFRGPAGSAFEPVFLRYVHGSDTACDSFVTIENNYMEAEDVDGDADFASCVRLEIEQRSGIENLFQWTGAGNVWRYNYLKSNRTGYRMNDQYDQGCDHFLAYGDTITTHATTYDYATYRLGHNSMENVDNHFRDIVYLGECDDDDIELESYSTDMSITIERTLEIYVKGGVASDTIRPVVGATVEVRNDLDTTVQILGETNSGGMVSGVVSYIFESKNDADTTSAQFNPFSIIAFLSDDSATNASFQVVHAAAGGTDTLTLTETTGDGAWGGSAPEVAIKGITLRGVTIQ